MASGHVFLGFCAKTEVVGTDVVVTVFGEIDVATSQQLWEELAQALESSPARLVIDLARVTFIDCSGLSAILMACDHRGSPLEVVLRAASPMATRLFELTGVDKRCSLQP